MQGGRVAGNGLIRLTRGGATPLAASLLLACAFGNAEWRELSHQNQAEVRWAQAGDQRCSDPAPFVSIRACLVHDAGYELARRIRCGKGTPNLKDEASEQARLVADYHLAAQMAADGYPEFLIETYRIAVRLGGWKPWYFGDCMEDKDGEGGQAH